MGLVRDDHESAADLFRLSIVEGVEDCHRRPPGNAPIIRSTKRS
jgi:hypothetical protein